MNEFSITIEPKEENILVNFPKEYQEDMSIEEWIFLFLLL